MYQRQKVDIPISDGGVTVKTIKGTGMCTIQPAMFMRRKRRDEIYQGQYMIGHENRGRAEEYDREPKDHPPALL